MFIDKKLHEIYWTYFTRNPIFVNTPFSCKNGDLCLLIFSRCMIPVQNGNFGHDLFCENTLLKFVKFQVCSIISIIFHHMKQFVNILHIYKLRAIQPYIFHQYSVISETLRIELIEVFSICSKISVSIL